MINKGYERTQAIVGVPLIILSIISIFIFDSVLPFLFFSVILILMVAVYITRSILSKPKQRGPKIYSFGGAGVEVVFEYTEWTMERHYLELFAGTERIARIYPGNKVSLNIDPTQPVRIRPYVGEEVRVQMVADEAFCYIYPTKGGYGHTSDKDAYEPVLKAEFEREQRILKKRLPVIYLMQSIALAIVILYIWTDLRVAWISNDDGGDGMFIRDLRWFLYVGTFVGSLIASVSTGDPRIWVLGIIVLLIAIASSRILLVVFDGRLSVPEPWVIDGEEGDHLYKVRMSEHIFGTDPFYIHSGDALVATLYKGADIAIPLPDDGTVYIGRSEELVQMRTELHLDRDRINYIWCKGDQSAIYNDVFEQGSEIDDRRCAAEYESARSQQLMNARNTALEMAFLVVFFMGLYYMAGRYEPGHGNIRTGATNDISDGIGL